ncbi:regulatory protein RecX [Brevibacterium sp. GP-SGM9]|uniref:regulatory protein RecX n=1 Tax=Brevibacterium sp. GP-SGM9 TaxID=3376990 RepID=UPI0039A6A608
MSSSAQAATLDQLRAAVSEIDERHAEGESEFFAPLSGRSEGRSASSDKPARSKAESARSSSAGRTSAKAPQRESGGGGGWTAFDTGEPPPFALDDSDSSDGDDDSEVFGSESLGSEGFDSVGLSSAGLDFDSDDSDSEEPDFEESYAKAKNTAMNMLAMRDHASQELREKLLKRDFLPDAVDELIAKLQKSKLLNDEEFAHRYVRAHRERRKLSQSVLRRELNKKGIPPEIISEAVDEVDGEEDLAREVAAKKAASTSRLAYEVRERRILGMLARRGFSSSICIKVTREVLAED